MKNLMIITLLLTLGLTNVKAQSIVSDSITLIHRPGQIGFIPPMSTNGWESSRVVNNVSVNLFMGYQGGLEGAEFAGFANVLRYDMNGAQFAGFGNTVLGKSHGAQFGGFYNMNRQYTFGAQMAGFANVVTDSVDAFQASGFVNFNTGETKGTQVAGFSNLVTNDVQGAQLSGFANGTLGDVQGLQVGGFSNVATGSVKGIQAAGFANVTSGDMKGAQISGFLNVAKKVNGLQIGVINVADTIDEGLAIGFLSISRNGYYAFEIEANETEYAMASLKLGTEKFYNTFSVGMRPQDNKMHWAYGYGIGTLVPLSEKLDMAIDLQSIQLVENNWRNWDLELHNRLKVNAGYALTDRVTVTAGPSFNILVSDNEDENGNIIGSDLAPWTLTNETYSRTNVKTYLGFNAGVRINL